MDSSVGSKFVKLSHEKQRTFIYPNHENEQDLGAATESDTIHALNIHHGFTLAVLLFEDLRNELAEWILQHQNKIHKAFITMRESTIILLVVRNTTEYDDLFEDELTDLSISIGQMEHFASIPFSVQSLPMCTEECYGAFCDPTFMFVFESKNASC